MKNLLQDQVAIVTGGNAGIGKAIAFKLAEEGAKAIIFGTNSETGAAAVQEIKHSFPSSDPQFFKVDVSKTAEVLEVIKKILEERGRVDLLVNNAGITADQLLMKMSEDQWDRVLSINLKSCYNTCHAVIGSMMKSQREDHQYQFSRGVKWKSWAGELCRLKSWDDWLYESISKGSSLAECFCQLHCARIYPNKNDGNLVGYAKRGATKGDSVRPNGRKG